MYACDGRREQQPAASNSDAPFLRCETHTQLYSQSVLLVTEGRQQQAGQEGQQTTWALAADRPRHSPHARPFTLKLLHPLTPSCPSEHTGHEPTVPMLSGALILNEESPPWHAGRLSAHPVALVQGRAGQGHDYFAQKTSYL